MTQLKRVDRVFRGTDDALSPPTITPRCTHPHCFVCSPNNPAGLQLRFTTLPDGSLQAQFHGGARFEGYPGLVHGGIISSVLDGAMTHCLFARGHRALTGELKVRFRHPVVAIRSATVRAWIDHATPPYFLLKAELTQDKEVKATGTGKFVEQAADLGSDPS